MSDSPHARLMALIAEGDDRVWGVIKRYDAGLTALNQATAEVEAVLARNEQVEVDDDFLVEILAIRLDVAKQRQAEP